MSSLDPLIDRLQQTGADEIRVEPGQCICMVTGGQRRNLSREPVQQPAVEAICLEMLSPEQMVTLSSSPRVLPVSRGGQEFAIEFSKVGQSTNIVVRRAGGGGGSPPMTGAFATVQMHGPPPARRAPAAGGPRQSAARPGPERAVPEPGVEARPAPQPSSPAQSAAAPQSAREPEPLGAVEGAVAADGTPAIDELLRLMIEQGASDLHLCADCPPALRVDGGIRFVEERGRYSSAEIKGLLEPILTPKARSDFNELHDADFAHEVAGLARFRVNAFEDRKGVGAVMRQIPIEVLSAEKLGLSEAILGMCQLSKGMVVVTGPTGSGKSTTLAAMIDHLNKTRSDHIVTIEDPIEFVHQNIRCLVNQREISVHTMSFKNALRAALREDPDIVLVGEMRDLETIAIALETAETGHLVFGTLHTTTAVSTIDRIIDQFPTDQQAQIRVMLSDALKGVVAQVLLPKRGGGRVAAMEILLVNQAVSSLIREGKCYQIPSIMQTRRSEGMALMNDSLLMLAAKGLVEPREAWLKAVDKAGLVNLFKQNGLPTEFA